MAWAGRGVACQGSARAVGAPRAVGRPRSAAQCRCPPARRPLSCGCLAVKSSVSCARWRAWPLTRWRRRPPYGIVSLRGETAGPCADRPCSMHSDRGLVLPCWPRFGGAVGGGLRCCIWHSVAAARGEGASRRQRAALLKLRGRCSRNRPAAQRWHCMACRSVAPASPAAAVPAGVAWLSFLKQPVPLND